MLGIWRGGVYAMDNQSKKNQKVLGQKEIKNWDKKYSFKNNEKQIQQSYSSISNLCYETNIISRHIILQSSKIVNCRQPSVWRKNTELAVRISQKAGVLT